MHIFSILLFVISASLDNLVVGIAYGIKKLKMPLLSNLLIALISCVGTFLSMLCGKLMVQLISSHKANIIGSVILISLGLFFILNSQRKNKILNNKKTIKNLKQNKDKIEYYTNQYEQILSTPEKADMDNSGTIDLKEAITLGVALALNNIGLGIGASITGLNVTLTSFLTLAFSITTIPLGYILGKKFLSQFLENKSDIISGIIIILLGIYELFI